MVRFALRRLLAAVPVLLGAVTLSFFVLNLLPGDAVSTFVGGRQVTPEQRAVQRHELGLDEPLIVRYRDYLGDLATGDLGVSLKTAQPVDERIGDQLPATLQLTSAAAGLALLLGLAGGLSAALARRPGLDQAMSAAWLTVLSMPTFWLGLVLITTVSFSLGWLPATGNGSAESLILPTFTLAMGPAAIIAQVTRDALKRVEREPFIVTARAKGLRRSQVVTRHALRNALIPALTITGLLFGALITSAVVVEEVFARQGVGRLLLGAVRDRDLPIVQAVVLLIALTFVVINLLVDLLYAVIDPRIREGYSG
ncbi:ABC transporter permease [Aeromicrobium panaciterrae]|uniref:ABC transporter permease n=1 Tax=Aeromicrobium panaciterrae TaxID=363861 RepID=UPI0031D3B960